MDGRRDLITGTIFTTDATGLLARSLAALALLTGCTPDIQPAANVAETVVAVASDSPNETAISGEIPLGETWDVVYLDGTKAGYGHMTVKKIEEGGAPLLFVEVEQRFRVTRFGDATEPKIKVTSVETPAGHVVRLESRLEQGPVPEVSTGKIEGNELLIETKSTGNTTAKRLPWSQDTGGYFATDFSLLRQPMRPGETRTFKQLVTPFNEIGLCTLKAKGMEATKIGGETKELLRIDQTMQLANGVGISSILWCATDGTIMKMQMDSMEIVRSTKEAALDAKGPALDIGAMSSVPVTTALLGVHDARKQRYKVTLAPGAGESDNDPAKIFLNGPTQQVRPLGAGVAEIEVRSVRPAAPSTAPAAADASPADGDLKPNNFIQSDDPAIVAMANEAAGDEKEPWKIALALEKHAHGAMRQVNFSQTFATAADVVKSREGDCTEHAVLLAALARAKGIPARVAIGLVYVEGSQSFGFHMWDELYLGGQWIPLDATLGKGGIGAGHLKLAHTNLAGGEGYSSFLPVAKVMGRLKIEPLSGN